MTIPPPIPTYPSPIELRRAAERREAVGGAILAFAVVVGFVAVGVLLIPAPKPPSVHPADLLPAGAGGGLAPVPNAREQASGPVEIESDDHSIKWKLSPDGVIHVEGVLGGPRIVKGPAWRDHGAPLCNGRDP